MAELDHVDYLIQEGEIEPSPEAEPTGTESVTPGTPFSFDVEGLEPGSRIVFVRDRSPNPTIYVDSVSGDDDNRGLSVSTPLATIAAVQAKLDEGHAASLAGDSVWQEQLDIAAISNVSANGPEAGHGAELPIIDASDPIIGTWEKESGYTNVWKISHSHSFTANQHQFPVVEDGVQMRRASSIAAVDTLAGRYHCPQDESASANPVMLYIYSEDDPNSNGKEYRVPSRSFAIKGAFLGRTGQVVEGIHARWQGHNNGSIELGKESVIRRCVMQGGHKHNALQESGLFEDSICIRASRSDGIMHVFYAEDAAGLSGLYRRSGFLIDGGTRVAAAYNHDSEAPAHDSHGFEQCWYHQAIRAWSSRATEMSVDGDYLFECTEANGSLAYETNAFHRVMLRNCGARAFNLNQAGQHYIRNCISWRQTGEHDANEPFIRIFGVTGSNPTIENNTFITRNSTNWFFHDITTAANAYTIRNNVVLRTGGSDLMRLSANAASIDIDNNVYFVGDHSGTRFRIGSTAYTVAEWKALGHDTNSLFVDASTIQWHELFIGGEAGLPEGDFRLRDDTGLTLPDGTPIHTLGAQSHWDWNAREPVSGAPSGWPVVPLNLSEALAYAKNPAAWNFYP